MSSESTALSLSGLRILVTRPAHQAERLCRIIGRAGGEAFAVPAIEITAPRDPQAVREVIDRLDRFDLAVFISANAVEQACALVDGRWPAALRLAVVGRSSAEALGRCGLRADIVPQRDFSSEGLLALDELQDVAGRRVVIFRGEGGRELLAGALRERGAEVEYAEVYRRTIPAAAARELRRIAATQHVDVIIVTSNEGLRNLCAMAGDEARSWLLDRQLIVISHRTAGLAEELGFRRAARVAGRASDEGLVEAIEQWHGAVRSGETRHAD